uniref:Uncharacterized protein n=1 Tax=Heliothis virescens TaxID=7102 RepID=A0A2A4K0U5_HELVI
MSPRGAGRPLAVAVSRPRCANVSAVFCPRVEIAAWLVWSGSLRAARPVSVRGVPSAGCMVARARVRGMSSTGGSEGSGRADARWPVGILRRSGARAARRVLHVKYRSVPPAPSPAPPVLPLDIDDTVSCFCRCVPAFWPLRYLCVLSTVIPHFYLALRCEHC